MPDQPRNNQGRSQATQLSPDPLTALFISIAALGQRESSDPQDSLQLLGYCDEALRLLGNSDQRLDRIKIHLVAGAATLDLLEAGHPQADLENGLRHCLQAGDLWAQPSTEPFPILQEKGAQLIGLLIRTLPFAPEAHQPDVENLIQALSKDLGESFGEDARLQKAGIAQLSLARLLVSAAHAVPDFEERPQALQSAGRLAAQAALWLQRSGAAYLVRQALDLAAEYPPPENAPSANANADKWQCPSCGRSVPESSEFCNHCGASIARGA